MLNRQFFYIIIIVYLENPTAVSSAVYKTLGSILPHKVKAKK